MKSVKVELSFLKERGSKNEKLDQAIAVEFEVGGLNKPKIKDPGYREDGGMDNAGYSRTGGRRGMNRSTGGGYSGSSNFSKLFATDHVWTKLKLTFSK